MKQCKHCQKDIPPTMIIDGIRRWLHKREYCVECSPFGARKHCGPKGFSSKTKYSKEQLEQTAKTATSIADLLARLNLVPAGGNYKIIKQKLTDFQINTDHFLGCAYLKGKSHNWSPKIPLSELLVNGSKVSSSSLKKKLFAEKIFDKKCYNCGIVEWLKKPAPLELEHKNGDNKDNRIENLTVLCPNCHALTPTYRRRK